MNMITIPFTIQFFSDWHCGSGLSAGSDVDTLCIKDDLGLPFVPGKTIKGLLREAAEELLMDQQTIALLFGEGSDESKKGTGQFPSKGACFFSDATLSDFVNSEVKGDKELASYFFRNLSSTAIKDNGLAQENSLRRIEVAIPCELYGEIHFVPETHQAELKKCLLWIKRLGQNRHRGLGRCQFKIVK